MLIYSIYENYVGTEYKKKGRERKKNMISDSQGRTRCGLRSSDAPIIVVRRSPCKVRTIRLVRFHWIDFILDLYVIYIIYQEIWLIYKLIIGVYILCREYYYSRKPKKKHHQFAGSCKGPSSNYSEL